MRNKLKKAAAWAALDFISPGSIVGVGTGTTVTYFISALESIRDKILGTVSSSEISTVHLKSLNITVFDLNDINHLDIYIDSADEINNKMQMIKGGGAALTREKIIASVASQYVCIVDIFKWVDTLGKFPLPVEVIPMARNYVTCQLVKLGGLPKYRQNVLTDNGNIILDVYNLNIVDPFELERKINSLPGVVSVGLFAERSADIALISEPGGVRVMTK